MIKELNNVRMHIVLADDDIDDCFFFKKALKQVPVLTELTIVHDGEELMQYLNEPLNTLPDIIFLDLSMPRKNGLECLGEINRNLRLKNIDVIVLATSFGRGADFEMRLMNLITNKGARDFVRKPGDLKELKNIIENALSVTRAK